MRELKFRAWDKVEKKMLFDADPFAIHVSGSNEPLLAKTHRNENCIFEQYTGLKDKNGKEIYEGDIVHIKFVGVEPEKWVIGWDISLCRFGYFHSYERILEGHWSDYDLKAIDYRKQPLEIIGNIHENQELLGHKG